MNTELFLNWLHQMTSSMAQNNSDDMYMIGAKRAYQNIIELINMGVFQDDKTHPLTPREGRR